MTGCRVARSRPVDNVREREPLRAVLNNIWFGFFFFDSDEDESLEGLRQELDDCKDDEVLPVDPMLIYFCYL